MQKQNHMHIVITKHKKYKQQYPTTTKNMDQAEEKKIVCLSFLRA